MFHVKHSLWHRWCSGRRRDRRPARLGDLASLGAAWCAVGPGCFVCPWAAARPRAVRAASLRLGASSRSPARPRHRPRHHDQALWSRHRPWHHDQAPPPQPGLAALAGLVVSCVSMPPRRCVGRARPWGAVPRACDSMQKVRSPCGSADLRGTPAWPEFAQWRSAFTRCLASASSLS